MFKRVDESQMFKRSLQIALTVSLFFLVVSLITGRWGFFLWSLLPAFITSMNGYMISKKSSQKNTNLR